MTYKFQKLRNMSRITAFCKTPQHPDMSPLLLPLVHHRYSSRLCEDLQTENSTNISSFHFLQLVLNFFQSLNLIFWFEIFGLERRWSNNMHGNQKMELTNCSIEAVALYHFIAAFSECVSWKVRLTWRCWFMKIHSSTYSGPRSNKVASNILDTGSRWWFGKPTGVTYVTASRQPLWIPTFVIGSETETLRSERSSADTEVTDGTW